MRPALMSFALFAVLCVPCFGQDDEWKDATHNVKVSDDLTVFVGAARIGKVALKSLGRDTLSDEDLLSVFVALRNNSDTKKLDYRGWSTKTFDLEKTLVATASDELGNSYKRITFGISTEVEKQLQRGESIYPEKTLVDVLVFELPVRKATELRLLLPGEAVGAKGQLRLKVPIGTKDKDGYIFNLPRDREEKKAAADAVAAKERAKERAAEVAEKKKAADEEFAKKKPERDEKAAEVKFKLAESLLRAGKRDAYRKSLKEIVEKYPDTKAAEKAKTSLK